MNHLKMSTVVQKKLALVVSTPKSIVLKIWIGVLNLIKEGINVVGKENMILDPDCGMRMLSREMALLKLKKMKETLAWL